MSSVISDFKFQIRNPKYAFRNPFIIELLVVIAIISILMAMLLPEKRYGTAYLEALYKTFKKK